MDLTDEPDALVSASVIARLLLGAQEAEQGFVPAVRLRGARVTGRLDVSGGTVERELRLERCVLDEAPRFNDARTRELRLTDCVMPGFDGSGLRAEGYVSLSGSVVEGQVKLVRAQLSSGLRMNGTKITAGDERYAFFAGALLVEGGVFVRNAEITGGVRLTGARMTGGFFLEGARLSNPGRIALDGQNITVTDAMECARGFQAEGTVKLRGARIDGTLSFDQAGPLRRPGHVALQLSHATVSELILTPSEPIEGLVSMSYARFGVLLDDPERWPEQLRLTGATYESLRGGGVTRRVDWVSRDPEGFRPQPYEQLAAWYLRDGNEHLARRTQLLKMRRRRRTLSWPSRAWSALLDYTVGYGYRPWQAFGWLAAIVAFGTAVFGRVPPRPLKEPAELPDFNAFAYVIDLMVPIGAFGQRAAWDAVGWTQWLAYGIIAAGWILATALIAGVTRVLRPN
ncbi:hypothetical protein [Actinocorallia populi]|uniref:hypothetical protein n=1 Tax=Actinocorallia populi TaxID=2079200 RepID=UPI001E38198E|nr:hypothetical protein [Actinocorallia populi]